MSSRSGFFAPKSAQSASSPNLPSLERRISISKSTDCVSPPPAQLDTVHVVDSGQVYGNILNLPFRDSEMISSSAPGSLQSSPRRSLTVPAIPLSATPEVVDRPRTLPPKNSSELQKHIKEYEEISKQIKKAMEKEAKVKVQKEHVKTAREKKMAEYRKVWTEEILPNWEKKIDTKKAQEMWHFGLPPSVRGQVWKLAIGNELLITRELFDISMGHAQQTKATMSGNSPKLYDSHGPFRTSRGAVVDPVNMDELLGKEGTVALVSLDLPPDFPARQLFVQGGPMNQALSEVLEAYVAYRPDVGYVPSMSYLVADFLLNMDTFDSFTCLANFINKPFNLAFYITDRSQMYQYTNTADQIICTLLPKIHKHFQDVSIAPEQYLMDWFMTIFLKPLPLDIATRVWDLYLLEGEIFLFKITLALLKMYSHQFETYPREMCLNILTRFPPDIDEEELFDNAILFNLDPKKFKKLLKAKQ